MVIQVLLNVLISGSSLCVTIISVWRMVWFLSAFTTNTVSDSINEDVYRVMLWPFLVDLSLLCLFIAQHSVMAMPSFKLIFSKLKLDVPERSIYTLVSSLTLQLIFYHWQPVHWISLWNINTNESQVWWWFFTLVHIYGWTVIYMGNLITDTAELLGIKQVYYSICGLPTPMSFKSQDVQKLYKHMRHPSLIGFMLVFWIYPQMSIDRLLLAAVWSLYMVVAWDVDSSDYRYMCRQLEEKKGCIVGKRHLVQCRMFT